MWVAFKWLPSEAMTLQSYMEKWTLQKIELCFCTAEKWQGLPEKLTRKFPVQYSIPLQLKNMKEFNIVRNSFIGNIFLHFFWLKTVPRDYPSHAASSEIFM